MFTANAPGALALLFILVMVWVRTRLRYPRPPGARLRLTRAGVGYFAAVLVLLAMGWFAAPLLVQHLGLAAVLSATFARAAWFLGVYAAFIPLHRLLRSRGIPVFCQAAPAGGSAAA
jgi:hypothetical protein